MPGEETTRARRLNEIGIVDAGPGRLESRGLLADDNNSDGGPGETPTDEGTSVSFEPAANMLAILRAAAACIVYISVGPTLILTNRYSAPCAPFGLP